jgi:hypothetical protein
MDVERQFQTTLRKVKMYENFIAHEASRASIMLHGIQAFLYALANVMFDVRRAKDLRIVKPFSECRLLLKCSAVILRWKRSRVLVLCVGRSKYKGKGSSGSAISLTSAFDWGG